MFSCQCTLHLFKLIATFCSLKMSMKRFWCKFHTFSLLIINVFIHLNSAFAVVNMASLSTWILIKIRTDIGKVTIWKSWTFPYGHFKFPYGALISWGQGCWSGSGACLLSRCSMQLWLPARLHPAPLCFQDTHNNSPQLAGTSLWNLGLSWIKQDMWSP